MRAVPARAVLATQCFLSTILFIVISTSPAEGSGDVLSVCPGSREILSCSPEQPLSGITWSIWCQCTAHSSETCSEICGSMGQVMVDNFDEDQHGTVCEFNSQAFNYSLNSTTIEENNDTLVLFSVLEITVPYDTHDNATLCFECQDNTFNAHLQILGPPLSPYNLTIAIDYTASTAFSDISDIPDIVVNIRWLSSMELDRSTDQTVEYIVEVTNANTSDPIIERTTSLSVSTILEFNTTYIISVSSSRCSGTLTSVPLTKNYTTPKDLDIVTSMTATTTTTTTTTTTSTADTAIPYTIIGTATMSLVIVITCLLCTFMLVKTYRSKKKSIQRLSTEEPKPPPLMNNSPLQPAMTDNADAVYSVLNYKERKWQQSKQSGRSAGVLGQSYSTITPEKLGLNTLEENLSATYSEIGNHVCKGSAVYSLVESLEQPSEHSQTAASSGMELYSEITLTTPIEKSLRGSIFEADSMHSTTVYSHIQETSNHSVLDLDTLVGALRRKSEMWRSFAGALRVPQEQLEVIEGHCQSDFDSMVEVCDAWLNKLRHENTTPPTWQEVISLLHEAGEKELAQDLMKQGNVTRNDSADEDYNDTIIKKKASTDTVGTHAVKENEDVGEDKFECDSPPPIPPQLF